MNNTGFYTLKEMADAVGLSTSTISKVISDKKIS